MPPLYVLLHKNAIFLPRMSQFPRYQLLKIPPFAIGW